MKALYTLLVVLCPLISFSQEQNLDTRHIEVWGEAERSVTPNEIYTSITIKEYKKMGETVSLNKLEKQLVSAVKKAGIPEDHLKVENVYGYNWDWQKKKSDEFFASKSFELKTGDLKKLNDLLSSLDPEGLNRVYIKQQTHTDLKKIEEDLQVEALQNAREKARRLLNSVDEGLGDVLQVRETQAREPYMERMEMRAMSQDGSSYQSNLEASEIKISVTLKVIFGIE